MKIFKSILLISFILTSLATFGQNYLNKNEEVVFAFTTQTGKRVMLAKDKNNKYLIYRFGTKDKVEFEFPNEQKDSWSKFKYSFAFRGGGKQNEGIDLNYVTFTNNNFRYTIYLTYFASDGKWNNGVKVTNIKTNKVTDIKGKIKSQKGNIIDFRSNGLLKISDELYD